MAQLTHEQYETLEHAVAHGRRVAIRRQGRHEIVVVPLTLRLQDGREVIEARNPTTGHDLVIHLDEIESVDAVQ